MAGPVFVQAFCQDGEELSLALAALLNSEREPTSGTLFQVYRMTHRFYRDAQFLKLKPCETLALGLFQLVQRSYKQRVSPEQLNKNLLKEGLELLQKRLTDILHEQTEAEEYYLKRCETD